jgi:hypoxanthine phosphoribosyltransferase
MMGEPNLKVLLTRDQIADGVGKLAADITRDYCDKEPLLIGVLKGSFVFMADLIRRLEFPLEVDFICLSSYGCGTESLGTVSVLMALRAKVEGRDVLVVDDIIDSGLTTAFLRDYLKKQNAASVKVCALTDKPSRRKVPVHIDYLGFTVPDKFLVGYGLDWDEKYRNLPDICYREAPDVSQIS